MLINKNTFRGIAWAISLSFLFTIDGFLSGVGLLEKTGGLNIFLSVILLFSCVFISICDRKNFVTILSRRKYLLFFLCTLIFLITIFISYFVAPNTLKLVRDVIYISTYFMFTLVLLININKFEGSIIFHSFIRTYILLNIILIPLIAASLGFFESVEGRFEGGFGASSLNGNIIALFAGAIIIKGREYFSTKICLLLMFVAIAIIIASGTRSALVIVFFSYLLVIIKDKSKKKVILLLCGVALIGGGVIYVYINEILLFFSKASSSTRLFSIEDAEGGSIGTRLHWYYLLWHEVVLDSGIGGFGPGAAEKFIGYIPHLDLLKNYFDYSIMGGLAYIMFILIISNVDNKLLSLYSFLAYILICLHNAFLVPALMSNWIILTICLLHNPNAWHDKSD